MQFLWQLVWRNRNITQTINSSRTLLKCAWSGQSLSPHKSSALVPSKTFRLVIMTHYSSWTAPSEKVQYNVYLGAWTNWQRGRVLGATLTLESRYGLLLLSFTATFVGFVASRFWRIATLVLHRIYSTPEPRDALHHQRQVGMSEREPCQAMRLRSLAN